MHAKTKGMHLRLASDIKQLSRAHLLVVIHKGAPVEHVHAGLEAEHGLLAQLLAQLLSILPLPRGVCSVSGGLPLGLLPLCPRKLLQPHLPKQTGNSLSADRLQFNSEHSTETAVAWPRAHCISVAGC